ncbi:Uncharacterised protein [Halioglobus japonicus]|nr:Uncharacterised protein [Halioglobus japonicus]
MGRTANGRRYPDLIKIAEKPARPISFVVIRFSDEYYHNFLQSESAHDSLNEVIEIDNTSNLHYDNLSRAIIAGLDKAQNDIIAVIHEDVLLPDGWQSQFEHSLRQLEVHDPAWGMLGSVGWNSDGAFIGHWSDPHQFKNTFEGSGFNFQEAEKLDEQLLIMHRARKPNLDGNLPGIHFLGEDLKHDLSSHGLRCYAVNAPTIHKYADRTGEIIVSSAQSDKIGDRESATYLADEACCKDYVRWKHPNFFPQTDTIPSVPALDKDKILQLERPVIVVCKGEAEAELLRGLLAGIGVYSGSSRLEADEFQGLMIPVYKMVIEKFRCHASWQKSHTASSLQSVAAHMIRDLPPSQPWGFVFPESILVLPELRDVFPNARYVYFQRDPLSICTGAVARSARLDNHIGRISLPEAYRYLGIDVAQITTDDAVDHMISTTVHHLELVRQHFAEVANSVQLTLSFEVLVQDPESTMERLSTWLGDQGSRQAMQPIHIDAAMKPLGAVYSAQRIEAAADRLAVIRAALGYI